MHCRVARRYKSVDRTDKEDDAWLKLAEEEDEMKAEPAEEERGMLLKLDTKVVRWRAVSAPGGREA